MSNFFMNLISEDRAQAPEHIENALLKIFSDAVNIDWFRRDGEYEAIFYDNNIEHIALINNEGKISSYKINLPLTNVPEDIRSVMETKGEIMNIVEIHSGDSLKYEIIVRHENARRYLYHTDKSGTITGEKEL